MLCGSGLLVFEWVAAVGFSVREPCCRGGVFDGGAVCGGGGSRTAWRGSRGGQFSQAVAQYAVLGVGVESISNRTCSDKIPATDRDTSYRAPAGRAASRPANRYDGSYTGLGYPVTVSPRPTGAPNSTPPTACLVGLGRSPGWGCGR